MTDKDLAQATAKKPSHPASASTKWRVSFYKYDENGDPVEVDAGATFAMLHDPQGGYVADIHGWLADGQDDTALRERAALIVKAVNERQQLVEALERIVAIRDWSHDEDGAARREYDNAAEQARAALTATEA